MTSLLTTDNVAQIAGETASAPAIPTPVAAGSDRHDVGTTDSTYRVVSQHRTSEGTILYTRTADGDLQVRLQRPDTGETVLLRTPSAR